jgi:hypothetical protein
MAMGKGVPFSGTAPVGTGLTPRQASRYAVANGLAQRISPLVREVRAIQGMDLRYESSSCGRLRIAVSK